MNRRPTEAALRRRAGRGDKRAQQELRRLEKQQRKTRHVIRKEPENAEIPSATPRA